MAEIMTEGKFNAISSVGSLSRAVLAALGPAGSFFATIWSDLEQQKINANFQLYVDSLKAITACYGTEIDCLKNDLKQLKEKQIILDKIIQNVRDEWEEQKIPQYANMTYNCLFSPEPLDKKIQVIEQFSRLSLKDIELLQQFGKGKNTLAQICYGHYEENYIYSIIPSIAKLSSYWLIEETFNETAGFNAIPRESHWEDKCYMLTPYGKTLISLIKNIE